MVRIVASVLDHERRNSEELNSMEDKAELGQKATAITAPFLHRHWHMPVV
jgi:hypothetical protein